MKKHLKIFVLTTILFLYSLLVQASPVPEKEAIDWVNQTGQRLISALTTPDLQEKYRTLDTMFEENVDLDYMSRFVLGKYYKLLTDEQKQTYSALFKRYTINLYKTYPLDFNTDGLDFSVLSAKAEQKDTNILCRVMLPKAYATEALKSLDVSFRLVKNDSKIRLTDLKIGESSLLLTYRQRFIKMIKDDEEEMEWFLDDLSDLADSLEKKIKNTDEQDDEL